MRGKRLAITRGWAAAPTSPPASGSAPWGCERTTTWRWCRQAARKRFLPPCSPTAPMRASCRRRLTWRCAGRLSRDCRSRAATQAVLPVQHSRDPQGDRRASQLVRPFMRAIVEANSVIHLDKPATKRALAKFAQIDTDEVPDGDLPIGSAGETPSADADPRRYRIGHRVSLAHQPGEARDVDPNRFCDARFVQELQDAVSSRACISKPSDCLVITPAGLSAGSASSKCGAGRGAPCAMQ